MGSVSNLNSITSGKDVFRSYGFYKQKRKLPELSPDGRFKDPSDKQIRAQQFNIISPQNINVRASTQKQSHQ